MCPLWCNIKYEKKGFKRKKKQLHLFEKSLKTHLLHNYNVKNVSICCCGFIKLFNCEMLKNASFGAFFNIMNKLLYII